MKRHSRPYGCTFATCSKAFGSKNDWKRHENSQHFHLETWRCDEKNFQNGACAKVCYRPQTFQDHLEKEHSIAADAEAVKQKLESCRIGRNCQARFWCGFCNSLIELTKKGIEAWTERFDHIDDHFMGRHGQPKQNIINWVPVDGNKPRGEFPNGLDAESNESHETSSSSVHTSESSGTGAQARNVEIPKRKHSGSSDECQKKRRTVPFTGETVVYCVRSSCLSRRI